MLESLFREELEALSVKVRFNRLLFLALVLSSALAAISIVLIDAAPSPKGAVFLIILLAPPALLFSFLEYLRDRRRQRIEAALPEALFQIAAYPQDASIEGMVEALARTDTALGMEFRVADAQISAGFSTSLALRKISERNGSHLLSRALELLLEAYDAGGDLGSALTEIAEDIAEMQALQKDSAAALATQKYTVLAAVALFIPLILGLLLSVSSSLTATPENALFDSPDNSRIISAVEAAVQAYFVLLSFLASVFLALQEGRVKKAPVYFCMLAASGALMFGIARNLQLV